MGEGGDDPLDEDVKNGMQRVKGGMAAEGATWYVSLGQFFYDLSYPLAIMVQWPMGCLQDKFTFD